MNKKEVIKKWKVLSALEYLTYKDLKKKKKSKIQLTFKAWFGVTYLKYRIIVSF